MKKTCSNATSFVHIRSSRSVGPWPLATVRLDGLLVVIDAVYHRAHCGQQFADTRHQQKDRICQHVATMVAPSLFGTVQRLLRHLKTVCFQHRFQGLHGFIYGTLASIWRVSVAGAALMSLFPVPVASRSVRRSPFPSLDVRNGMGVAANRRAGSALSSFAQSHLPGARSTGKFAHYPNRTLPKAVEGESDRTNAKTLN